jgi:predicted ferric reductase
MSKIIFRIFIFCGMLVLAVGVYFILANKSEWFRIQTDGRPVEYHKYNGWQIIIIGTVMLLIGIIGKWRKNNLKS